MKKEQAKAVQVSIKQQEGQAKGPLGGGNGRAGASLFAPLRAEEAEEWKPLKHFHANVRASLTTSLSVTGPLTVSRCPDGCRAGRVRQDVCAVQDETDEHHEAEGVPRSMIALRRCNASVISLPLPQSRHVKLEHASSHRPIATRRAPLSLSLHNIAPPPRTGG